MLLEQKQVGDYTNTNSSEPIETPLATGTASDAAISLKNSLGQLSTTVDKVSAANFKLYFNGSEKNLSSPMLQVAGRTYLPLRALGEELLGANVSYDSVNSFAIVTYGDTTVEILPGSNRLVVNSAIRDIDYDNPEACAFIQDGRTYIPVRAVAEAFGCDVLWDAASKSIRINVSGTPTNL